jgi:thiol-disulfide isomerase/thioredoxin
VSAVPNGSGKKKGKREGRELSKAKARELERRRQRNRTRAIGAVAGVAVAGLFMFMVYGGQKAGTPSAPGQVRVMGPSRTSLLGIGEEVPSFNAPALGGGRVNWRVYGGRPVVLALWASWCQHCQKELPVLAKVAEDFPEVDLVTIVSAVGTQAGPSPEEYMKGHGLTFPVAIDDEAATLAQAFGVESFPTLYFVTDDGKVLRGLTGELSEGTLRTLFAAVIARSNQGSS